MNFIESLRLRLRHRVCKVCKGKVRIYEKIEGITMYSRPYRLCKCFKRSE